MDKQDPIAQQQERRRQVLGAEYGAEAQVARIRDAGAWQTLALAELAEAVAALVLEVDPRSPGVRRS